MINASKNAEIVIFHSKQIRAPGWRHGETHYDAQEVEISWAAYFLRMKQQCELVQVVKLELLQFP